MKKLRKKSLSELAQGLARYEDSRNVLKSSDYTDLQTFLSGYLNTPDKKLRKKLAEEFRKRHMELYTFILRAIANRNNDLQSAVFDGGWRSVIRPLPKPHSGFGGCCAACKAQLCCALQ